jgi:hypothetical protein
MLEAGVINKVLKAIIDHQFVIMGPLAFEQANKVPGLKISDGAELDVEIDQGDPDIVLTNLVKKYEELFGRASIEVCKDAVKELKPAVSSDDLPEILR